MKIEKQVSYKTVLPSGIEIEASTAKELKKLYAVKTKVENQKIEIKFPFVLKATDYHEFDDYRLLLVKITKQKISYREFENNVGYNAVFWVGDAEPEETKKAIEDFLKGNSK